MRVEDIIDAHNPDIPYKDYELSLIDPIKPGKEVWAKYEEVRQLTKKEATLARLLYD